MKKIIKIPHGIDMIDITKKSVYIHIIIASCLLAYAALRNQHFVEEERDRIGFDLHRDVYNHFYQRIAFYSDRTGCEAAT